MIILNMVVAIYLSVLAADLLYLYCVGGWSDPIKWIEKIEVVMLYILFLLGLIQFLTLLHIAIPKTKYER